jgi:hypothetical protein
VNRRHDCFRALLWFGTTGMVWIPSRVTPPHQVASVPAKGDVAIASRLDTSTADIRWLKPSGEGVFSAVSLVSPNLREGRTTGQRAIPVRAKGTPAEYRAGLDLAIERG